MKQTLFLFILFFPVAVFSFGGPFNSGNWTFTGNPVCNAASDQELPQIISDNFAGAIIVWADKRNGSSNTDIYAQRIDATGAGLWGVNGKQIINSANDQFYPRIKSDGSGGCIIAWTDKRSDTGDIYAIRIDNSGNPVAGWNSSGNAVCTATYQQLYPDLYVDGSGNSYFTWRDYRSGSNYDVYAQKLNASGSAQWAVDGVAVCTAVRDQISPNVMSDGTGGCIAVWQDFRDSSNYRLFAQRVNNAGTIAWVINGDSVVTTLSNQVLPVVLPDLAGGVIIIWEDTRPNGNSYSHIYGQRINIAGARLWSDAGKAITAGSKSQSNICGRTDLAGGAFITYVDNSFGTDNICAQRINSSGDTQWAENKTTICSAVQTQSNPKLYYNGIGGVMVTWQDYRDTIANIYCQNLNTSGDTLYALDGVKVCTGASAQIFPDITSDSQYWIGSMGGLIVWQDERGGFGNSDIYSAKVITDSYVFLPSNLGVSPDTWVKTNTFTLFWANPADSTGIAKAYYKIDTYPAVFLDTDGWKNLGSDTFLTADTFFKRTGTHDVYVWLEDRSGNRDTGMWSKKIAYFDSAVSSPIGCTVTPSGWSPTNSFNVNWTNPADTSYIYASLYKFDTKPTSSYDSSGYVVGTNINLLSGISVPTADSHLVYVWLRDVAGNVNETNTVSGYLKYDPTKPDTPSTSSTSHPVQNDWYSTPTVSVSWSASDSSGIVCYAHRYDTIAVNRVNTGETVTYTDTSINPRANGTFYLHVSAKNGAGLWSDTAHFKFNIDTGIPGSPIGLSSYPDTWGTDDSFTVYWTHPADTSGIGGGYYKLDTSPTGNNDTSGWDSNTDTKITGIAVGADGEHTVYVWLKDMAGNRNYATAQTTKVYLDKTIGSPQAIAVSPDTWTTYDTFIISWTNPADSSGITGAFYRLDSPPGSNSDSNGYNARTNIDTFVLNTGSDGAHTVYVWLADKAGTKDYTKYAVVNAYYDSMLPAIPVVSSSTHSDSEKWYNSTNASLSWISYDSTGITGYSFVLDETITTVPDAVSEGIITDTTIYNLTSDTHYFHVRAKDASGFWGQCAHFRIGIDTVLPYSRANVASDTSSMTAFTVSWTGADSLSGAAGYDVQFREGSAGSWTDWKTGVSVTSDSFFGCNGKIYYFRTRAYDNAGNYEEYPSGDGDTNLTVTTGSGDVTPPVSSVNALAQYSITQIIAITISGTDDAGGAMSYWVDYKINSGSWVSWISDTTVVSHGFMGADGNTYYFRSRSRDANGNYELTRQSADAFTAFDLSPPVLTSFKEKNGKTKTKLRRVDFEIVSSGATSMIVSENADFSGTDWEAIAASKQVELSSGDGEKTVYIKIKDASGNEVGSSYKITLDMTAPKNASVKINNGAKSAKSAEVTLNLKAEDANYMVISEDSLFSGASYEDYGEEKKFMLSLGTGTKTVNVKFKDDVSNEADAVSSSIIIKEYVPANEQKTVSAGKTISDGKSGNETRIEIPKDAFSDGGYIFLERVKEEITADLNITGVDPKNRKAFVSYDFNCEDNGEKLRSGVKFRKPVKIYFNYPDGDNDGKIDGTDVSCENLSVFRWDGVKWNMLGGNVLKDSNDITVSVNHLSRYAVFASPFRTAGYLFTGAFPNPFTPNSDGINDAMFFNFVNNGDKKVNIKIYNRSGVPVRTIEQASPGEPWDGKDNAGENMAGGLYIFNVEYDGKVVYTGTCVLAR